MRGTSKAMLAQTIIQASIEEREQHIEKMLSDRANDLGISVDELKEQLLERSGGRAEDDDDD